MANSTIGSLKVFLGLDAAEFEGGLKAARNNLRRVAREMQQVGREISATGAQLSVALTAPLALFGAASVKAASDAEEMGSAFRYVFGAAARDVEAWAKTTGDALGRSTFVLQQQALTFQQLFKQAAPTNQAAAEMSKQFTLLAQDLSSFFNVAEGDALQKLRAGLVGEAEPLRAFGVFLTAAAVEARAFEMGLAASSKELTEQDKILARAALILEATKDAQGDAARTSDSFANRSKALKAALNELQVTLGKTLLPALTDAATAAAGALNAFNNLSPGAQTTALALAGVAASIGPLNLAIGAIIGSFASATKAVTGLAAGSGVLKVAMTGLVGFLGPGGLIAIGLAAAGTAAVLLHGHFKSLKTASAEVTQQTEALNSVTADYTTAAALAASASGEARVSFLQEAAAKRELAIQTRDSAQAKLSDARATLAQLQAQNAQAIANDRYSFRGDAAGTIRPTINAGATSKARANVDALTKSIAEASAAIASADKVIQAGSQAAAPAAAAVAKASDTKAKALDKERKALEDAKTALLEYLGAEQKALAEGGLSSAEVKAREIMVRAHEAYLLGLTAEAKVLADIAAQYRAGDVELSKLTDTQVDFVTTTRDLKPEFDTAWDGFVRKIEDAEERFIRTQYAVEDLFFGIRGKDWVGAFSGLVRAIDQVKAAFDQAGNSAGKVAALAGVGQAAGNAIGGKVGGALSGAASGAATGFTLGGPVGAVVGGILGGLGGLFGASKAKKRAKAQAKADAERRAAELAAAKRGLEIRLMELGGDAAGALAAAREAELAGMDASLRALQQEIWAKEDAARAEAEAAALVAAARALQIEKLEALGQSEEALAMIREDELAALPEALRDLQRSIYAVIDATEAAEAAQDRLGRVEAEQADLIAKAEDRVAEARAGVADAIEAEISAIETARDRFADLADELAEFGRELRGSELGGASLTQQLAEAQRAFDAVKGKTDAESLARLPELGRALIAAQAAVAPNQRVLNATVQEVARATAAGEAAARNQVSAAAAQIAALNTTAAALGALRETTLGLQASQDRLAAAIIFQSGVMREAAAAIEAATAGLDQAMAAAATAANANTAPVLVNGFDGAAALDAAALGGTVPVAANDVAPLADLAAAVEAQGVILASIAHSTSVTASVNRRWDGDGMPEVRNVETA